MSNIARIGLIMAAAIGALGRVGAAAEDASKSMEGLRDVFLPPPKPPRKPVIKENFDTKARKQGNREMLRRVRQMKGKK